MDLNTIYNEDLFSTINRMNMGGIFADVILTSPPYNTGRNCGEKGNKTKRLDNHETRYDIYMEKRSKDEYIEWTEEIFNAYDTILAENGCVLYNMSYGNENPTQMWLTIASIIENTNFTIADTIIWKKKTALPNNVSGNKLTRICEFVFVLCRKSEYKTFKSNKKVISYSKRGQKIYENIYNFVEARNNDGSCKINKATYSTELCEKLLSVYAQDNSVVYDSFMGTGTTAVAALRLGHRYIGSELSEAQCKYAEERIKREIA